VLWHLAVVVVHGEHDQMGSFVYVEGWAAALDAFGLCNEVADGMMNAT
jgi:hypothetical protein